LSAPRAGEAESLAARIAAGELSAEAAVRAALAAAESIGRELGAFESVDSRGALARARAVDAARARGEPLGPLAGVPFARKANLCLAGAETHAGSRVLEGYRPPYTATAVERLAGAGAVALGATGMDEFGFGSSGENSAFAVACNPWDTARTAGGSSSGNAAAVAAGIVPLALGSDTGGSVRQPAALCGVTGFKPSYGRVSRYGLIAFASSLDCVGVIARSVGDVELALGAISGADERDPTSLPLAPLDVDRSGVRGLSIGLPRECEVAGVASTIARDALREYERLGARLVDVSLPHLAHAVACYYVVAMAEASSNLARYDGVRYGARAGGDGSLQAMIAATRAAHLGREAKRRVLIGTYALSHGYYDEWYLRAARVRRRIAADFEAAFGQVDLLAMPTSPTGAFPLGSRAEDPLAMYAADVLTVPASLAALPALSIPCGFDRGQSGRELPVGLQIVGPPRADARVLAAGRAYQERTDHHLRRPPISAGARA
jgi:aspartyl-tRNA(Asn)/glutamyl-tRNA(Gln) amidotransferase subunit A